MADTTKRARKRMLADVLWTAANGYLTPTVDRFTCSWWSNEYSCNAVVHALQSLDIDVDGNDDAQRFMESLGCNTISTDYTFAKQRGRARQGVRYMWLLLAMHVAEDEGIEL